MKQTFDFVRIWVASKESFLIYSGHITTKYTSISINLAYVLLCFYDTIPLMYVDTSTDVQSSRFPRGEPITGVLGIPISFCEFLLPTAINQFLEEAKAKTMTMEVE